MEHIVANIDNVKFDVEVDIEEQRGTNPLPFPGMDKSMAGVCTFYTKGLCVKGALCPMRHIRGDSSVVCKHWLRGLCKKGDQCDFLHEYDMSKMPECYFYSRYNACHNKECPFLHIDPESKVKECPWYDRGFCRHGPFCRHTHVRRVICMNYLAGFCPDGPDCKYVHPRFELPTTEMQKPASKRVICHFCGDPNHKAMYCDKVSSEMKIQITEENATAPLGYGFGKVPQENLFNLTSKMQRPLTDVTCFKCRKKGHYANKCDQKFAFLSTSGKPSEEECQEEEAQTAESVDAE